MNLTFREARLQDQAEVFGLASRLATSFKPDEQTFARIYVGLLEDRNADLIVAADETAMIGYLLAFHHPAFYANGTVSWVEELFVREEFRRKNVGKRLMEQIQMRALERGSKLISLATRRAGEFYKAIGYEESAVYFRKTVTDDN